MAELEKAGVPTVAFVARGFEKAWQGNGIGYGVNLLPRVLVSRPLVGLEAADIHPYVDAAFDSMVSVLTGSKSQESSEAETPPAAEVITVEGDDRYDAFLNMNRLCLDRGWGDGFPLLAPTREYVNAMLAGTRRNPTDVVAILPPGLGMATVEKIAINAVMAGCHPEHLAVLIAAVEAISDPRFMLRGNAQSTGAHAPLMLINGPLTRKLGINTGRCALGPGSPSVVNTVLGRTLRLVYMNLAHAYPGIMDMDTLGSPTKYSMCLGEDEETSPWIPYHVEKGFDRDVSTVTVHSTYGLCEVDDNFATTPEALLDTVCSNACSRGIRSVGYWLHGWRTDAIAGIKVKEKEMLIVGPVHAAVFKKHRWDKQDIREYLYKQARMPFAELIANLSIAHFRKSHPDMEWICDSPQTMVPILETADCFEIAVAGGAGSRSSYSFGAAEPVTRAIEQ